MQIKHSLVQHLTGQKSLVLEILHQPSSRHPSTRLLNLQYFTWRQLGCKCHSGLRGTNLGVLWSATMKLNLLLNSQGGFIQKAEQCQKVELLFTNRIKSVTIPSSWMLSNSYLSTIRMGILTLIGAEPLTVIISSYSDADWVQRWILKPSRTSVVQYRVTPVSVSMCHH